MPTAAASPHIIWIAPFVAILLAIAVLPLIRRTQHWWEHNRNKLAVALLLSGATLAHYFTRGLGFGHGEHAAAPGIDTVVAVLRHALIDEYLPFIILLFCLYVISGGIVVRGDIRATPLNNTCILGLGGLLASLIGTTGASMLLIRLLLKTNSERRHVVHTVVFFVFIVSNVGGLLLPIGDPPLFLGYLRGVPFWWTLKLWREWAFMLAALLVIYYAWDEWAYRRETPRDIAEDRTHIEPLHVGGVLNVAWLLLVVAAVATLDPSRPFPGSSWTPAPFTRELVLLMAVAAAWITTAPQLRAENSFNFVAIGEVACLFIGIFITMQVPLELLRAAAPQLAASGFDQPWHYFWASGALSSFLDNAPTYVVFFQTALPETGTVPPEPLLIALSCGSVFMGANTYIGNGPNFMVKSIAEQSGVRMPSFFGYMAYSGLILIPLFAVLTLLMFAD
ncbi:MAG: hypothetical protein CHACPFDD_00220 [Phycisphaerae bacterium]|nr:hypothetical protein [Phycisphaerae bacterium]